MAKRENTQAAAKRRDQIANLSRRLKQLQQHERECKRRAAQATRRVRETQTQLDGLRGHVSNNGAGTVSVAEAAELLGKSTKTIYRWVNTGELRAHYVGHSVLIPKRAVEKLLRG